ncbi:MAG: hypothetical protein AAGM22_10175 [Acidobacteriota bacterium]
MSVSSSQGAAVRGRTILHRLFLLGASLTIGTVIWFLLGDSEGLVAEEKLLPAAHASTPSVPPSEVIAHVDGVAITGDDIRYDIAEQLDQLEEQRRLLLRQALESRIARQLLQTEASVRGLSVDALLAEEVDGKLDTVDPSLLESRTPGDTSPEARNELRRQLRLQAFVAELRVAAAVSVYGEPAV